MTEYQYIVISEFDDTDGVGQGFDELYEALDAIRELAEDNIGSTLKIEPREEDGTDSDISGE